jgi:hypothetical protein
LFVALCSLGGCGSDGSSADAGPGPDAWSDAGGQITGNTAKGVFPAAQQIALTEQPDAVLYRLQGERLVNGGREVDPAVLQSYWSFNFISPSTGIAIDVLYAGGIIDHSTRQDNPEGKRLFTTDWLDSSDAVDTLVDNGFQTPDPSDPYTLVGMRLEMYGGTDPDLSSIAEPIWRLNKVTAPPGMTPMGVEWWITYWSSMGAYLVCDLSTPPPDSPCWLDMP